MPISDAYNKGDRLTELQMLFWNNPGQRLRTPEIAQKLGVSESTALRYLTDLETKGRLPIRKDGQFWILAEDATLELPRLRLTAAEAAALFVSGRLLAQIYDERNTHVIQALLKLLGAFPQALASHQHRLVDMARERQEHQQSKDISKIFEAIALGWITHHQVRIQYAPPRGKTFECMFEPYLLEPSGVGRTIYVLGRSMPLDQLRTFKLERIQHAELLKKAPFEIAADFDGPALLKKAWGVMYGDEDQPVEVRLRFSHRVTRRVKETLWHPSQQLADTPAGCELTIQIGDTLEIENWIRGWGSDCEVLEPSNLREKILEDAQRTVRNYTLSKQANSDDNEEGLFSSYFEEKA
jgi:predicted DNA-binding transcriptional regulator YafY